jgi:hypothetical protein
MTKQHYYLELIPPRPTFAQDMTDDERQLMQEHARYMREQFDAGKVIIYGPVMASKGAFGMAVLEVVDETEARQIFESDPSVKAGLNRFELYAMRVGAARAT